MFESRENSYGIIRLTFPFGFSRDYGREKSSEIGVDGHDVPLIPHPSNAPPHPTNPTWGGGEGGVGHMGLGGGVGHLGGGVLEEYRVHMHIYTHVGTRITVGKKLEITKFQIRFNHFLQLHRQNESEFGAQLIR